MSGKIDIRPGFPAVPSNGERLLVVDDEEFIRLLVRERLEVAAVERNSGGAGTRDVVPR